MAQNTSYNTTAHSQLKYFDIHRSYLDRLIKNRSRAILLQCTINTMSCLFFGHYVLVTVVDRGTEAAVYIQDADDWDIEYTTINKDEAEKIFDRFFNENTEYSAFVDETLKLSGFKTR